MLQRLEKNYSIVKENLCITKIDRDAFFKHNTGTEMSFSIGHDTYNIVCSLVHKIFIVDEGRVKESRALYYVNT